MTSSNNTSSFSVLQVLHKYLVLDVTSPISLITSLDAICSSIDVFLFKRRFEPMVIFHFLRDMISSFDSCQLEEKDILLSLLFPKIVQPLHLNHPHVELESLLLRFSITLYRTSQAYGIDSDSSKSLPIFWLHSRHLTNVNLPNPVDVNPRNLEDLFRLYVLTNKAVVFFDLVPTELLFQNHKLLEAIFEESLKEELIDASHSPTLLKCLRTASGGEITNQSDFTRIPLSSIPNQRSLSSIFNGFIPLIPWILKKIEAISPCFNILIHGSENDIDMESLQRVLSIVRSLSLKSYSLSTETSKHVRGLALYYFLNSSPSPKIRNLLLDEDLCINVISSMIYFHDWKVLQLHLQKVLVCHSLQSWSNRHIIFRFKSLARMLESVPTFLNECIPSYFLLHAAIDEKIDSPTDALHKKKFQTDVEHILTLLKSILKLEEDPTLLDFRSNASKLFPLLTETQKWILYNINYTDPPLDFLRKQLLSQLFK